jgi:hypothetical protein
MSKSVQRGKGEKENMWIARKQGKEEAKKGYVGIEEVVEEETVERVGRELFCFALFGHLLTISPSSSGLLSGMPWQITSFTELRLKVRKRREEKREEG